VRVAEQPDHRRDSTCLCHPQHALAYACIDIGSNTTRILVAEVEEGRVRELMTQRAFTRIGKGLQKGAPIPRKRIDATVECVATQTRAARELGVKDLVIVATAAIRKASNRNKVLKAIEAEVGVVPTILSGKDEARLSFVGALAALGSGAQGSIAVVDVGGGSTEIAVGTPENGVKWSESFDVGSGFLADSYFTADPPGAVELHRAREHALGVFEGLEVPSAERAVAVGGSANSLRRVTGAVLEHETLERALRVLASEPAELVADRFSLDPDRVRVLPAGTLLLEAVSDTLGLPLHIAGGGLREGVVLELAAAA